MKHYIYVDLDGIVVRTREQLLADYWGYWKIKMLELHGENSKLISEDNYIADYCVLHWAWEVDIACPQQIR